MFTRYQISRAARQKAFGWQGWDEMGPRSFSCVSMNAPRCFNPLLRIVARIVYG